MNSKKSQDTFRGNQKEKVVQSGFGKNMRLKNNRFTQIPKRIVQIDTYPKSLKKGTIPITQENAEQTFKDFLKEHKNILGVEPENLKMVSAKQINKKWFVKYEQNYKGIPIHNASIGIESSEDGKVNTYVANYYPDIKIGTKPQISLKKALEIAIQTYAERDQPKLRSTNETLTIYPVEGEKKFNYSLVWKFLIMEEQPNPELEKYFMIDTKNGNILSSYNSRFPGAQVSGTIQAEVYPVNPEDTISTLPLMYQYVRINDAGKTTTDLQGKFSKPVNWSWQFFNNPNGEAIFQLEGPFARVQDLDGSDFTETRPCNTNSQLNFTWSATDRDHINVFYHMNLFHDWLKNELGYSWINPWDGSTRFNARVNDPRNNAWAGDPMIFGINNIARSSDVIYHECTHNILFQIYGDWIGYPVENGEAYAMDEGFADYFSCSFNNESILGEQTSFPRDLDNDTLYPGKTTYNIEGHSGGKIIAGAAWEFRKRLVDIYGITGARIADQLILEAHQILATFPRDYYFSDPNESNLLSALYQAADTDNNLQNGFPYFNDIQHAFHSHGLLQAILDDGDSFDFSTNVLGTLSGGDLYFSGGKFWANNLNQKGVIDLGDMGDDDLAELNIPKVGYTRFGVEAVSGHTYISKAHKGETGSFIAFRVDDLSFDKSTVTIRYFYRLSPYWYIANSNSKEIHKSNCKWVSLMASSHKIICKSLDEVEKLIHNRGFNGCHYCLPRYDTDTLSDQKVLQNLTEDLA